MRKIQIVYIKNKEGLIVFTQPCTTKKGALAYMEIYNARSKKENRDYYAEYNPNDDLFEDFLLDYKTIKFMYND